MDPGGLLFTSAPDEDDALAEIDAVGAPAETLQQAQAASEGRRETAAWVSPVGCREWRRRRAVAGSCSSAVCWTSGEGKTKAFRACRRRDRYRVGSGSDRSAQC